MSLEISYPIRKIIVDSAYTLNSNTFKLITDVNLNATRSLDKIATTLECNLVPQQDRNSIGGKATATLKHPSLTHVKHSIRTSPLLLWIYFHPPSDLMTIIQTLCTKFHSKRYIVEAMLLFQHRGEKILWNFLSEKWLWREGGILFCFVCLCVCHRPLVAVLV